MPMLYEDLLRDLVDEARQDEEVIGLLLTGSLARGDALPGTDIDLRYILTEGADRPYRSTPRDGVLVEQGYADLPTAREKLEANPMDV
jgi:predicted nucleotidyltransferase